jgi:Tol biopolymer transport system component
MVLFDNRVSVNTMADARLTMTGSLPVSLSYGVYHNSVSWSADGRYIASFLYNPIAGHNNLEVYQFNGTAATLVSSVPCGPAGAVNGESMWSKDGRYIAFFGTSATDGNNLRIFYFNGRSLVQRAIYNWNAGAAVWGAAFSPDGRFVVACGAASFDGYFIKVFRFDGWSLRFVSGIVPTNVSVAIEADWSPDGRHIAVGQQLSAVPGFHTQIYRFNGTTLSSVTGLQFSTDTNSKTYFLRWSPDGRFVAIAGGCYPTTTLLGQLQVLRFTGKSLVRVASSPVQGYYDEAVGWSPDGNTISVGVSNQNLNKLYRFDGSSLTLLQILTYSGEIRGTEFSPDGRYLAVAGSGGLNIYSMLLGSVTTPQTFSTGLVFGDSAKGSSYNANVKVLAGAGVVLQGKVTDDSA